MPLDNKDLSSLLEVAVVAARAAGQRAMEEINYVKASRKSSSELVTEADVRCQQIIIDTIKRNFSDHGFVGEEGTGGKIFKQSPRGDNNIWWVIDPIDGTNNFVHRILNFAVSIGVINEGKPALGVIFDPCTESIFTAAGNTPAQLNNTRIEVNDSDLSIFESIGIESIFTDGVPNWVGILMSRLRCRSLGTMAMHLAYVASGSFVAGLCNKPKLWDIAAGAFLVETAGGIVTDWKGNPIWPVDMNNYTGQAIQILAANKKVHKKLIEIINR